MPANFQGHERLNYMKYHMFVIIILLSNRHWVQIVSSSLVAICQYLSSTVQNLVTSNFYPRMDEVR